MKTTSLAGAYLWPATRKRFRVDTLLALARLVSLCALMALMFCAGPKAQAYKAQAYEVAEVPLTQIEADLASGKTTSVVVTNAYIERIKKYDGVLKSVILIAPDAVKQAQSSDARRKAGKTLGPMDGVPILLKDNIDAVGMPTTAGSFALTENFPVRDSEVARRLRAAGAVILGKANLSQFASWRGGVPGSTVGGIPDNPYRLGYTTSGSSSGPGVAAAASLAAATVGSDTTGSVTSPASLMGLAGMRPTLALISRRGVVPVSLSQDTTGPMARSVADLSALLTVLAGTDPEDPATKDADAHKSDYVKGLNAKSLKGVRIGVVRGTMGYTEQTAPVFNAALAVMAVQGATLVEVPVQILEDLHVEQIDLINFEFREDLEAYLKNAPPAVKTRTLADIMEFNRTDPRENKYGQPLMEQSAASRGRADPAYAKLLEYVRRRAGAEGLGQAMRQYNVSALVMTDAGPAQPVRRQGGGGSSLVTPPAKGQSKIHASGISALAGYPDLTVPMGNLDGLPMGISFVGPPWSEQMLLSLGYAYEQAAKVRVAPTAYMKAVEKK